MTKNEDISNPYEVTERKTLAAQNIVDKNKYLTIFFFSPTFHPYGMTMSMEKSRCQDLKVNISMNEKQRRAYLCKSRIWMQLASKHRADDIHALFSVDTL